MPIYKILLALGLAFILSSCGSSSEVPVSNQSNTDSHPDSVPAYRTPNQFGGSDVEKTDIEKTNVQQSLNTADTGQFVYLVKAECPRPPRQRSLSGVRIAQLPGIITALHGVTGCESIWATSLSRSVTEDIRYITDLVVAEVDIERDIALLIPRDTRLQSLLIRTPGIEPVEVLPIDECDRKQPQDVWLWGYPAPYTNTDILMRPGTLICRVELFRRLPATHPQYSQVDKRKSPLISIFILDVAVSATSGYSGAPLVISQSISGERTKDKLVGILIGGLPDTVIKNAWVVPWSEVELKPIEDVQDTINHLSMRSLPATMMAFLGSELPRVIGKNNIAVVGAKTWDGKGSIQIDLVEVYGRNAWLAVFGSDRDPHKDQPFARVYITAPWTGTVSLHPVLESQSSALTQVEADLRETGRSELRVYLFVDRYPHGEFNRYNGDTLNSDEIIPLEAKGLYENLILISP